ncbi:hypothetical protein QQ045_025939 [Rhodiola kirilowii]
MDEYLQYMRNLRSQMNDVEDQAAMTSVEEQTLITTIQTLEKDIQSEKAEAKKLEVDIELMVKAKGDICTQIIERQRKIAALESDSLTLAQNLELLHQENTATTTKSSEKRSYYDAISKDIAAKFQDQKEWIDTHSHGFQRNTNSSSIEAPNTLRSKVDSAN